MKSNFTCFSETFDYALGWTVIHSLWQAMAIAILMGIAMIVLRKKTAKVRYWVANTALLAVLLAAITTFTYYYDISKEPPVVQFTPDITNPVFVQGEVATNARQSPPLGDLGGLSLEGFKAYFNQHIPLIVLVWIMGVALFILKLLGGISYVYYLRSRLNFPADEYWIETLDKLKNKVGVKQSIDLVESALTRTPMVVGHLKPMILFPIGAINKLSPTEVEAILAHEIAHVMRKDFIFNILQSVVEALFYYHPAVWVISSTIRNERENCCDDVAIEICGNSMDYAKALVMVQEMAYYPMYQPAMAFAGNRKNQLLYRVQRILNQPQNKTNVMEKLIATCMLVVVMMGLSFGEKTFANNKYDDKNTPSVASSLAKSTDGNASPESPNLPTATVPTTATFHLYFKDKIDSLRVPDDVKSGEYVYNDNIQDAVLTVRDHYIVALKVNNIDLTDDQFPNYKRLIDKIIRNRESNNEGQRGIVDKAFNEAGISFQNDGMKLDNDRAKMSIDKNGLHLNGVDDKGQSFNFSVDENGLQMEAIGDDGKPVKMNLGKNAATARPQKNTTFISKGIVTTFDENGEKWVIKPEKDGIKYIEHFNTSDKLVETLKIQNGKVYINNREATNDELRQRGWEVNGYGIQRIGGFSNIQPSQNYNFTNNSQPSSDVRAQQRDSRTKQIADLKSWRKALYDKAKSLGDSKDPNIFWTVKQTLDAAEKELKNTDPSVSDLEMTKEKLNWAKNYLQPFENEEYERKDGDLQSKIEDLKSDVTELRKEIKECECATNFDFRKGLIERLDRLFPAYKAQNEKVLNAFELRFLEIKNEWERGKCDDHKVNNGTHYNGNYNNNYNNNYNSNYYQNNGNLDFRVKEIARKAKKLEDAIDDCKCKERDPNWAIWATARLNAEYQLALANKNDWGLKSIENEIASIERQFNRLKTQKNNTNCQDCPPGNGQNNASYATSPNGYSYGTGSSYADAERARADAARQAIGHGQGRGDDEKSSKAMRSLFQNLINQGYISIGKKCNVSFNHNVLMVNSTRISGDLYTLIKTDFEKALGGKKGTYAISFSGIINSITNNNLDLEGSMNTSINQD
jgi:beta-lactamase regulating signal transducer with metallopeptidase domain